MEWEVLLRELRELWTSVLRATPRMLVALLILSVAWLAGRTLRSVVRRVAARRREPNSFELAVGRLGMAGVLIVGALVAATVAIPNFTPSSLVGALGLGSVAIGFAFKDIFQNFLAGVLILVTKPFRVDDQIVFGGYEGTVEEIQTRATFIRTYDGRRVIIPNGELFVNSVTVNTAFAQRRMEYDIGISWGDDIEKARHIILDVLRNTEGVDPDPKADVIVVDLAPTATMLRARWWSRSRIADVLVARDKVLSRAIHRLQAEGFGLAETQRVRLEGAVE